jgi:hypothetical protein
MSKLKNVVVAFLVLWVFTVIPAFPQGNAGCKNGKFIGSYTHVDDFPDVWGDGSNVEHQLIQQLNLHSDGTVTQENAGGPDNMLSFGLSTPFIGSWTCRNDDAINHPTKVPAPPPVDLFLFQHVRVTSLFSVTNANTLTRIQARTRRYPAAEDPTDPTGGILGRLRTPGDVYTRLVASDADLLAP